MMNDFFGTHSIPSFENPRSATWAPILLNPIPGSYETLVVGIVIADADGVHVEMANQLKRLNCLYGDRASGVIFSIGIAEKLIQDDLSNRGLDAIVHPTQFLTGVSLGSPRKGEGEGLAQIARSWLDYLSSLQKEQSLNVAEAGLAEQVVQYAREAKRPLPQSVLKHVNDRMPEISRFFSFRIISGRSYRVKPNEIDIDYRGQRLVANIAALKLSRISSQVGLIKQRLYDLKLDRERSADVGDGRLHELIVEVSEEAKDSLSRSQAATFRDVTSAMIKQADELSLRFLQFDSAEKIAEHIVLKEAA
jgi:hypothetical protein